MINTTAVSYTHLDVYKRQVKDAGKAERKPVAQKRAMTGKEKKPSIHERLEINKKIIQEKQGKDKLERGADLGVR